MAKIPTPVFLLTPNESRTRTGILSPVVTGGVIPVASPRGRAWQIAEATENLIPNPRGLVGGSTWSMRAGWVQEPAPEIIEDGVTGFYFKNQSSSSALLSSILLDSTKFAGGGGSFTLSGKVRITGHSGSGSDGLLYMRLYDGVKYLDTSYPLITASQLDEDGWATFSYTYPALLAPDASSTSIRIYYYGGSAGLNADYTILKPQLEKKAYATPYADGSLGNGHAWTGTANASTSTRAGGKLTISNALAGMRSGEGHLVIRLRNYNPTNITFGTYHLRVGTSGAYIAMRQASSVFDFNMNVAGAWAGGVMLPNRPGDRVAYDYKWSTAGRAGQIEREGYIANNNVMADTGFSGDIELSTGALSTMIVEGVIGFDRQLTEAELNTLLDMPDAWAWSTLVESPTYSPAVGRTVVGMEASYYLCDRNGSKLEDISELISDARLTMNQDAQPVWQITGKIRPYNYFRRYEDCMLVEVTQDYSDGSSQTYIMGVYWITVTAPRHDPGDSFAEFRGEDLTAAMDRNTRDVVSTTAIGSNLANLAKIHTYTGAAVDQSRVTIPTSTKTAVSVITFEEGTSFLLSTDTFLSAIGFRSVYQTREGFLTSTPAGDLLAEAPVAQYSADAGGSMIDSFTGIQRLYPVIGVIQDDPDDSRLRNRITVQKVTPGEPTISYTASNTNPASPLYINGPIGILAGPTVDDPKLVDQAAAQAKAEQLLSMGSSYYRKVKMQIVPDLNFNPYDTIELDIRDATGEVLLDGKWWRRAVEIPLGPPVSQLSTGMTMYLNRVEDFK